MYVFKFANRVRIFAVLTDSQCPYFSSKSYFK